MVDRAHEPHSPILSEHSAISRRRRPSKAPGRGRCSMGAAVIFRTDEGVSSPAASGFRGVSECWMMYDCSFLPPLSPPSCATSLPSPAALFDRRLAQRRARDERADGAFWCSVVTTGVYCRPSCPSRHARPAHIRFHDTLDAARRTGFRPCKRCQPEGPGLADRRRLLVERACEALEQSQGRLTSQDLARSMGVSSSHLYRMFQQVLQQPPGAVARSIADRFASAKARQHDD
ncbi:Bifunctional transcriptional activator/DNA repair enzyme Ada [compost metagenome]